MSIRLNKHRLSDKTSRSSVYPHIHYGCKEDVSFEDLFQLFHKAFPLAFNRETFQRVYDASDISNTAYRMKYCWKLKLYAAILATSTFDSNQKRQLKILMLVEDEHSLHAINVGRRLLVQLIETCKELENIHRIYAYVESTNLDGIHFYTMMGFQRKETLPDYFPQRASLTPDAVKLVYEIGNDLSTETIQTFPITNQS
ncbi:unnamed protein product [Adineta ricciae]|uniref:N-acetyltransferase domain-containing protein n=1 Tax=Adineta ricciae TaxID=249248 RepID=A0A815SQR4_ADIRI|nr:unnamed protein product [Adineta ricciae]